jgi:hypothetical protein
MSQLITAKKASEGTNFGDSQDPLGVNAINWDAFDQQLDPFFNLGYNAHILPNENTARNLDSLPVFNDMWGFDDFDANMATEYDIGHGNASFPSCSHNSTSSSNLASSSSHPLPTQSSTPLSTLAHTHCDAQLVASLHIPTNHAQSPAPFVTPDSSVLLPAPTRTNCNDLHIISSNESASHAQIPSMDVSPAPGTPIRSESNATSTVSFVFPTPVSTSPAQESTSFDQPLTQLAPDNRRSGRPLVPSKRIDQMNMIGSKTLSSIPSADKSENVVPGQTPEWVSIAKKSLLDCDLGDEWRSCVEGWLVVEEQLDFGMMPGCKVSRSNREISHLLTLCVGKPSRITPPCGMESVGKQGQELYEGLRVHA